ncbi:MAG: M48 family metallopeptidase [Rubrivivax sp.]|nr:M48 family metallopeptidase [Rubrivivax sp.]MDP3613216.1 M48 family metallopeptidase [Rubrivivax sp.]
MNTHAVATPHTGCVLCHLRTRRRFTALLAGGAVAAAWPHAALSQQAPPAGVRDDVGKNSRLARLVPADWLEGQAAQQYQGMMHAASQQRLLLGPQDRQVQRLRAIAQRIVPHAPPWNSRATKWAWEVNLLNQPTLNAFCMPGGKIAFYMGILRQLQLSDDEVASIMGHEVAHALREHARERLAKSTATRTGAGLLAEVFGLGGLARGALSASVNLLELSFSRDDETEADLVGMDLAARAGYNPAAGVTLWQKMMGATAGGPGGQTQASNRRSPAEFLSTHPAGATRIKDIQAKLPKVQPLYARAAKPGQTYGPPPA